MERLKILYFEVLDFLRSNGGPYRTIDSRTCSRILHSLDTGQYYLKRDGNEIATFCAYRPLLHTELGFIPQSTTSTLFVTDSCNKTGSMRELVRQLRRNNPDSGGVAWYRNGELRHFPRQKGER